MADRISLLPLEIVLHVLSHLPFESLLAFGETSRFNYRSHILCLRRLRLGVFEKRIHSMISCIQAGWATPDQIISYPEEDPGNDYTVTVIQPNARYLSPDLVRKSPSRIKGSRRRLATTHERGMARTQEQMTHAQNKIFSKLVNRYGPSLVKLEFMAYDLDIEGARALGTRCQHALRHLALRFEHQHIRDGEMRPSIWLHPAPPSTAWNLLLGVGRYKDFGLSGLEILIMERSGITPWQLRMLVKHNPRLKVLKLRTCRGAQPEFLKWLGGAEEDPEEPLLERDLAPGRRLEVLWLENCHRLLTHSIEEQDDVPGAACDLGLEWVRGLTNLQSLSFNDCMSIPPEYVERANRTIWKIPEVILPYSLVPEGSSIEIDPMLL